MFGAASALFDRQPVSDAHAQSPNSLHAPNTRRELGTEKIRIGCLVGYTTHLGQSEVDGGGCIPPLFEVDAVPQHDGAIERQPWLGGVKAHELVDRMGVGSLTAG